MTKHLLLLLTLCSLTLHVGAWDKCQQQRLTEAEFRAKQRAYITEHAGLTEAEADKFFPLYFELQDKKREINDRSREINQRAKDEELTDAEYLEIIDAMYEARLQSDKLEMDYLKRFKKVLSGRKLYRVQRAEMKFHMDMVKGMRPGGDKKGDGKKGDGRPPKPQDGDSK